MTSKAFFYLVIFSFIIYSCAKIPSQSITLMEALTEEGARMHSLNTRLLDKMFKEKSEKIDAFIKDVYTPKFIENFIKLIPKDTDLKKELPDIIAAITPKINARRDSMQDALEIQRRKLTTKLEKDFQEFNLAAVTLKRLLNSAIKVDKEREELLQQIKTLSGGKIDLEKIESKLDEYTKKAGNAGAEISNLDSSIDQILNTIKP